MSIKLFDLECTSSDRIYIEQICKKINQDNIRRKCRYGKEKTGIWFYAFTCKESG